MSTQTLALSFTTPPPPHPDSHQAGWRAVCTRLVFSRFLVRKPAATPDIMAACNFHFRHCPNQITGLYPHYTLITSKSFGIRHSPTTPCNCTQTVLSNELVKNRSPSSYWIPLNYFYYNTLKILLIRIQKVTSSNLGRDTGFFFVPWPSRLVTWYRPTNFHLKPTVQNALRTSTVLRHLQDTRSVAK